MVVTRKIMDGPASASPMLVIARAGPGTLNPRSFLRLIMAAPKS